MQRPQKQTVMLEDIVITEELSRRHPRSPNLLQENQFLHALAQQLVNQPQTILQNIVDIALELCVAGTVGVSLLEMTPTGEEVFRVHVLAGALAQYVGGTTKRDSSPSGVTLERGTPQLFAHPERYFTYLQTANVPIVEELVLPLIADRHVFGTIWIASHDEQRHFDSEDVRIMTSLAGFTATALVLQLRQTRELVAANAALEVEIGKRKQSQEQLYTLISNLPGGAVFVVDRDLRYLLAEGEALAIAEFTREDFVGRTIFEVLPSELATYYEPRYRRALAGEEFEHEHHAHDRTYISRGTPLRAAFLRTLTKPKTKPPSITAGTPQTFRASSKPSGWRIILAKNLPALAKRSSSATPGATNVRTRRLTPGCNSAASSLFHFSSRDAGWAHHGCKRYFLADDRLQPR